MKYISFSEVIEEIFVIDGNIIVKAVDKASDSTESKTFYIPEDGFYDITSTAFNGNEYNENVGMTKALVMNGISNILNNNLEINKSLKFNKRGNIDYNKSDIKIFINKKAHELANINEKDNNEVIKVLIKDHLDTIYSFDMKLRGGYLVIYQNEYPVNKVSEELSLDKKVKTKTKRNDMNCE